ncbi:MAG TPA: hypothetical protein DCQ99_01535 [Nitrospinae bacterium]|nr:hypothetical protein [Nitrospinota bacterium]HBA27770.1 hypothetical protein [Nitrospinota bacterium]
MKSRVLVLILALLLLIGGGIVSYRVYDYLENDPIFCKSCHIMETAFASWEKSVHVGVNCHDCHHISPQEGAHLFYSFIVQRPESVPPRHGKIIVAGKFCIQCHLERDEKYPQAVSIRASQFHEKHGFEKKIECSKCHGYKTHEFLPEERFCVMCHEGKEVHGAGMVELACLNCHSDRTKDLRPEREKCLFCHGSDEIRVQLIREERLDVKHFTPSPEKIKAAIKINIPADSKHQFDCYACHIPHEKARPDWSECINCHGDIVNTGKHELHMKVMNINCGECHKLHSWVVTEEQAKKGCIKCHESAGIYKEWAG